MIVKPGPSSARKLAWAGGVLIAIVVAIHWSLPLVMNTAAMRARILSRVSQQFSGEVDFGTIEPALLPLPRALVTDIRLAQADQFSIQCEKAVIYPRLLPLFFGRLIIDHLMVLKPDIKIVLPDQRTTNRSDLGHLNVQEIESRIRAAAATVFENLGLPAIRFKEGRLELNRPGTPGLAFSRVNLRADVDGKQLVLLVTGHSNFLETFKLQERVDLNNLDGNGRLNITGMAAAGLTAGHIIALPAWLSATILDLDVAFQNRSLRSLQAEVIAKAPDIRVNNGSRELSVNDFLLTAGVQWIGDQFRISHFRLRTGAPAIDLNGSAVWSLSDRTTELSLKSENLDIGPIRSAALQLIGDSRTVRNILEVMRSGRVSNLALILGRPASGLQGFGPRFDLRGRLSDGMIALPNGRLTLEGVEGEFELKKGRLSAGRVSARSGRIEAHNGSLVLGLMDDDRSFVLDTEIDADLSQVAPLIRGLIAGEANTTGLPDRIPAIEGRASGRLRLGNTLDHITGSITADAQMNVLDAALDLSAVSVNWAPSSMSGLQADLKGALGNRALEWIRQWGSIPDDILLEAPVAVSHANLSWTPPNVLGIEGEFITAAELKLSAMLRISPDELELSRLHVKDTESDGVISINHSRNNNKWRIGFSGRLAGATTAKILRPNDITAEWLEGDLQADIQSDAPLATEIRGRLDGRRIDITQGTDSVLSISDASLVGQGSRIEIAAAGLKWQQSSGRLTGSATFTPAALELDLALSADTLDANTLATAFKAQKRSGKVPALSGDHTLPVRGRIRTRAEQLYFDGYRFAPVQGVVSLQDEITEAKISVANLCGISMPGSIRFEPDGLRAMFDINASGNALRDTDRCLAGTATTERIEGTVSAGGSLQTHGRTREEFTRNLTGKLNIQISDGRVFNIGAAGFFTNLLSFISVNQLIQGKLPDLREDNFEYKSLSSKLAFNEGKLHIEEGILKSNAVNIVGNGDYILASKKLDLVLLVSPLTTVDWIIERIPLIGNILQGTLVAIPAGVKGPLADPRVIPLSPSAVGSRLGGILKRTIKTPFRILSPLLKGNNETEN